MDHRTPADDGRSAPAAGMAAAGTAPAGLATSAAGLAPGTLVVPNATFRSITEAMPQMVWSTTPDGYHDYFNERWYAYTGMPRPGETGGEGTGPDGLPQGWNWKDYLHPDDYARTVASWTHCLATGDLYEIEYRFKEAATGAYRWFLARGVPLRARNHR
jgi:PAS domain-containing protein